jgi:hypothetical protein
LPRRRQSDRGRVGHEPGGELLELAALAQRHAPQDPQLVGPASIVSDPNEGVGGEHPVVVLEDQLAFVFDV